LRWRPLLAVIGFYGLLENLRCRVKKSEWAKDASTRYPLYACILTYSLFGSITK
jgi:hypothetical protein